MPAAVSETSQRAADAHQAQEDARQRRTLGFSGVSRNPQLRKAERQRVAGHDQDQRSEPVLCEWTEQRRMAASGDFPLAQRARA